MRVRVYIGDNHVICIIQLITVNPQKKYIPEKNEGYEMQETYRKRRKQTILVA